MGTIATLLFSRIPELHLDFSEFFQSKVLNYSWTAKKGFCIDKRGDYLIFNCEIELPSRGAEFDFCYRQKCTELFCTKFMSTC